MPDVSTTDVLRDRAFVRDGLSVLAAVCAAVACQPAGAAQSQAAVISLCSPQTRLTQVVPTVSAGQLNASATCVADRSGATSEAEIRKPLPFAAGDGGLTSIHSPEIAKTYLVKTTLGAHRQSVEIRSNDGRACAEITATTARPAPALARFLGPNGDWASAIDYMVDDRCQLLVVRLGNQLAVVPAQHASTVDLYAIHFVFAP